MPKKYISILDIATAIPQLDHPIQYIDDEFITELRDQKIAIAIETKIIIYHVTEDQLICEKIIQGHDSDVGIWKFWLKSNDDNTFFSFASYWPTNTTMIRRWNIENGLCVQSFKCDNDLSNVVVLNDDMIVSHDGGEVKLWNLKTEKCEQKFNIGYSSLRGAKKTANGSLQLCLEKTDRTYIKFYRLRHI